jgi:very-short-patch-repair endonuclease
MKELDKIMYYGSKPITVSTARLLRHHMTGPENALWERLKNKQIMGLRFRRQHPIDIFIADFYCHAAGLVIEIDGELHNETIDYDNGRTEDIEKFGLKVVRFTNQQVLTEIEDVIETITKLVLERRNNIKEI